MPSASDPNVNAVSHKAWLGVSKASDIMTSSQYLQTASHNLRSERVKVPLTQQKFCGGQFLPSFIGTGSAHYLSGIGGSAIWDRILLTGEVDATAFFASCCKGVVRRGS